MRVLRGKKNPTLVRMVTTIPEKCNHMKGCLLFPMHVSSNKGKDVEDEEVLNNYVALQQFQDVFLEDIPELPPHREVDFSIELMLGVTPTSKALYKMSTP